MDLTEIETASERIYEGRIVHLDLKTVRLPNGQESKREIVQHRGAVCIVPLQDDGTVLMVKQFRLAAGKVLLEIPAGTLNEGEEPPACAARELTEETGRVAGHLVPLFSAYLAPGYSTEKIHAFLATSLRHGAPQPDEDENLELVSMPLKSALELVLSGKIEDSKSISALLVAARIAAQRSDVDGEL